NDVDIVLNGLYEDEMGALDKTVSANHLKDDIIMLFSGENSFGIDYLPIIVRVELYFQNFILEHEKNILGSVGEGLSIIGSGGVLVGLLLIEAGGESGGDGAIVALFGLGISIVFGLIWFIGTKFNDSGDRVLMRLKGSIKLSIYDKNSCEYFSEENRYEINNSICEELFVSSKDIYIDYSQSISDISILDFNDKFNEIIKSKMVDIKKDLIENKNKVMMIKKLDF
ncbi:hypothetical protein JXR93_09245, partial [bacterium]|nr:hypothetical protein [bacterium]